MAQTVNNLPAMWENWVRSLDQEDPLEKGTATHSSILVYKISWTEESGRLQSMGSQRVGLFLMSTTNWHLPRALPTTEQQKHLPSSSKEIVKHLATMPKTWVQSLGWEDLLGKEMATHFSILAWKIPWMEELGRLQSMGSQRVGLSDFTFTFHFLRRLYPQAAIAIDIQQPLREFREEWGTPCSRESGGTGVQIVGCF